MRYTLDKRDRHEFGNTFSAAAHVSSFSLFVKKSLIIKIQHDTNNVIEDKAPRMDRATRPSSCCLIDLAIMQSAACSDFQ